METALQQHVRSIVTQAIEHPQASHALIVFDRRSTLASLVTDAYQAALPEAACIDFDTTNPEAVLAAINALAPRDLVVLVQSGSFRLNQFRFRLELFKRQLAVIEHPHLNRMPEHEWLTYIDALAYDQHYYRTVGPALKQRIDAAKRIVVRCANSELVYTSAFEDAKLNIGDYRTMKNIGGQFPIGEVFTEPIDFTGVNGTVELFAYGDATSRVVVPSKPVRVTIKEGMIVDTQDAPASFTDILGIIEQDEPLWVRELGFGMNRAMTRTRTLNDVGSYERMCGIHLSLGQKHTIYTKPGFPKRSSKYHVDVFADVQTVTIDETIVFQNGQYCV